MCYVANVWYLVVWAQKKTLSSLLPSLSLDTQDLETLKEQNRQLKSTRSEMDDELHTLTENLFEEAYKMVDEAKGNKVKESVEIPSEKCPGISWHNPTRLIAASIASCF